VAVKMVLIKYNTQCLIFQPDLVAQQVMLTDVSGCQDHSGGRHPSNPFCKNMAFPVAVIFPIQNHEAT
jgi:hypothetical protein